MTSLKSSWLISTALLSCFSLPVFAATATPTTNTTYSSTQSGDGGTDGSDNTVGMVGTAGTAGVDVNATGLILNNTGTISGGHGGRGGNSTGADQNGAAAGAAGNGVTADQNNLILNNSGTIQGGLGGSGGDATNGDANGGAATRGGTGLNIFADNMTIRNTGLILGGNAGNSGQAHGAGSEAVAKIGGDAIILGGNHNQFTNAVSATVRGGTGGAGNSFVQSGTAVLVSGDHNTIINDGTLDGQTNAAVSVTGTNGAIVNTGHITATQGKGLFIDNGATGFTLDNRGTIHSDNKNAIDLNEAFGSLVNLGTVTSNDATEATLRINHDQTANGSLVLNGTVINTATNNNAVAVLINTAQTQTGNKAIVNTGSIIADGTGQALATAVQFEPNVTATLRNQGIMRGAITASNGAQTVINDGGQITGTVSLGSGNNIFTMTGGTLNGSLTTGIDDDQITLSGGTFTGDMNLNAGNNVIALTGGTSTGLITTLQGNDQLTINGGVHTGDVSLGHGDNTVVLSQGRVTGNLTTGLDNDHVTIGQGLWDGAIDLGSGANTLVFDNSTYGLHGANTVNSSGTIDLALINQASLVIGNVATGLRNATVNPGSSLAIEHNTTFSGVVTNNATIAINPDVSLNVNAYDAASTGTLKINVGESASFLVPGRLNIATGGADLSHGTLVFALQSHTGQIPSSPQVFVTAGNSGIVTLPSTYTDTSLLYDFTVSGNGTDTVRVLPARVAGGLQSLMAGSRSQIGYALDQTASSADPQMALFQGALSGVETRQALNQMVSSVTPTVDRSATDAATNVTRQSFNASDARLSSLRTGLSSGDAITQHRVWLQPFAVTVGQNTRNGIAGYQADTYGATLGADTDALLDRTNLGVAVSYGQTNATSDVFNQTQSDISAYQLQLYGDYDLGGRAFVTGMLGYGFNTIDQTRSNVGGITGLQANADYHSQQYSAAAAIGQTYQPAPQVSPFEITPSLGVRYLHLMTDDYSETGAGGLNLNVATQDQDALELSARTVIAYPFALPAGTLRPSIHIGYTYDVIGDDLQTASSFASGGASFGTRGADPAQSTFNMGAGLSFYGNAAIDLSLQYDAQIKADYTAHAGYLRATYRF